MTERYLVWSEELEQEVTITRHSPVSLSAYTADGVLYTPAEIMALRMAGAKVPRSVHVVKKMCGGTIDSIRHKGD